MIDRTKRLIWWTVGMTALALGTLGIFLPLLPTTPFVLLAAFAFARSSPRLHAWLLRHRIFGPLIEDWRRHGAIARGAKIAGIGSILAVLLISFILGAPAYVLVIQTIVLGLSATFILTRPLPPRRHPD